MKPFQPSYFSSRNRFFRSSILCDRSLFLWLFVVAAVVPLSARQLLDIKPLPSGVELRVSDGLIRIHSVSAGAVEVVFEVPGRSNPPSEARATSAYPDLDTTWREFVDYYELRLPLLTVRIDRKSASLSYWRGAEPLFSERGGFFRGEGLYGFRFQLDEETLLMGGGSRVFGKMDRRGERLRLLNKPSYGYNTEAPLMYYSMPMVMRPEAAMLIFDNGARGTLDLGHTLGDLLEFSAEGGRMSYLVISAPDWPSLMREFSEVTGKQPLPPRWALGNISSRMGYRSQQEVLWVADGYRAKNVPLDAIVIDLFWFGPDLKGHMGNLAWDSETFPNPEKMMRELREEGVKTVLITEPFVLTSSKRYEEVASQGLLGTDSDGEPFLFDFYFGNTGLLDIFKPATIDWFWGIYKDLTLSGVSGWWGDLGEPEVHPDGLIHSAGVAQEVHNIYGHAWARLIAEGYARDFPNERPLILMRAGFVGSQRYGMIPWSGDVERSWGGLSSQVEIALQMSLQGLAYMHSDLGGFAGNSFDAELYTRWMQYGVFQPVYRPHAQEEVPPEPIFWDTATLDIVRRFIQLRYALTPYNYTLAEENSRTGMPLMRPLFFEEPHNVDLFNRTDGYLWGDAFLVYPVTAEEITSMEVYLPEGSNWFDFFSGKHYTGGRTISRQTPLGEIPIFVRAGSIIPMIPEVNSLDNYPHHHKIIHYWHDPSVPTRPAALYNDDGVTAQSEDKGPHERFTFEARQPSGPREPLMFSIARHGQDFPGRAESVRLDLVFHNWTSLPKSIQINGQSLPADEIQFDPSSRQLRFSTNIRDTNLQILVAP